MILHMETKIYFNYVTKQRRIVEFKTVFSSGMRELTQQNVPHPPENKILTLINVDPVFLHNIANLCLSLCLTQVVFSNTHRKLCYMPFLFCLMYSNY